MINNELKVSETKYNNLCNIFLLVAYSMLTLFCSWKHEMWFDEAEAWAIVKYNDMTELFEVLKSEGHPILWYLIIKLAVFFNIKAEFMPFIGCMFSIATVILVLWKSPFNIRMKIIILFSSGMIYYNTVMSRVYCLIPLLLCLLAYIYPVRKERPLLYGIIVALLTNTHIFMFGLIASLGIYMIIDLITDWRANSANRNFFNIMGLGIAGIGVIVLIVAMFGSMQSNSIIAGNPRSFIDVIENIFLTFYRIGVDVTIPFDTIILPEIMTIVFCTAIILMIFFARNCGRTFIFLWSYILGYFFVCGVIWRTNPNRSSVFLFIFVFCLWIAHDDCCFKKKVDFSKVKTDSRLIGHILKYLETLDLKALRVYERVLSFLLCLTIPAGIALCYVDITDDFSPERRAISFIKDNYTPEDTVIVSYLDMFPQISLYASEYKSYSLSRIIHQSSECRK